MRRDVYSLTCDVLVQATKERELLLGHTPLLRESRREGATRAEKSNVAGDGRACARLVPSLSLGIFSRLLKYGGRAEQRASIRSAWRPPPPEQTLNWDLLYPCL